MKSKLLLLLVCVSFPLSIFGCGGGTANPTTNEIVLPDACGNIGDAKVLNRLGECVAYTTEGVNPWYSDSLGRKIYFGQPRTGDYGKEYTLDAQGNKTYLN
jgi:hypothetical protein